MYGMEDCKVKIILADDNVDLRNTIREYISKKNDFEIVGETEDGEKQLELILNLKPDIVITDLKREKGMSGLDVIRKCNELEIKNVDFLVLTGCFYEDSFSELMQLGVSNILRKPYDFDMLLKELIKIKEERTEKLVEVKREFSIDSNNRRMFMRIINSIKEFIQKH